MYPCSCGGQFCQSPADGRCQRCSNWFPAANLGMCPQCKRVLCLTCLPIAKAEAEKRAPNQTFIQATDDEGMPV